MLGAWWRKNVIEKVHAAAYSGRFTIKVFSVLFSVLPAPSFGRVPCVDHTHTCMMPRASTSGDATKANDE